MKKRKVLVVAGVLILLISLGAAWYFISEQLAEEPEEEPDLAVAVEVKRVKNSAVQTYVELTGRLQPEEQIEIFAEVSGIMESTSRPFKVGAAYTRGELLVRINDDEARQELISQRSNFISVLANTVADLKIDFPEIYDDWANYLANLAPNRTLPPLPETKNRRQKLFLSGREIYGQFHAIKQMEVRISKYRIHAPFTGTLTEVMIDRGTLVRQGQRLGEFVRAGSFELQTSVGLKQRVFVDIGDTVTMRAVQTQKTYTGTITRINEKVSPETQTIEVFVKMEGEDLTTGMYLEGRVKAEEFPSAVRLPRKILVERDHVFIVEDSIAKLRKVEVLFTTADEAVVKGIEDNAAVIMEEHTTAFDGTRVSPVKQEDL